MAKYATLWQFIKAAYKYCDRQLTILAIRLLSFYYAIVNYIRVLNGENIISYKDVQIYTSLIYKREIAPLGYVFYIAKIKVGKTLYSKNVAIYRKDLPLNKENILKQKVRIVFANMVTKQIN